MINFYRKWLDHRSSREGVHYWDEWLLGKAVDAYWRNRVRVAIG